MKKNKCVYCFLDSAVGSEFINRMIKIIQNDKMEMKTVLPFLNAMFFYMT